MRDHNKKEEESFFPSPLKLPYTAYSDERPVYSQVMEKCFERLDELLVSLPEKDRERLKAPLCKGSCQNRFFGTDFD